MDSSNSLTLHLKDKVHSKLFSVKYRPELGSSYQDLRLCCSFSVEVFTITAAGRFIIKQHFNLCFPEIQNTGLMYYVTSTGV